MASNIFRSCWSGRLRSDNLVKKYYSGVSQNIANEFWILTTNASKKISLIIKNAAGALVASTLVKYAIFEYDSGIPYNDAFMRLVSKGAFTTDVNGVLEILYIGIAAIGETAYVAVIHPNTSPTESMIWGVTVS